MDPTDPPTSPGDRPPTPGEAIPPAVRRLLERAPSERYLDADGAPSGGGPEATGSIARAVVGAVGPAVIGAVLLIVVASPLAMSEPLVVVAALVGLGAGFGTRLGGATRVPVRRRRAIAVGAALAAVALAEVAVWQLALGMGGVLPFLDFQGQVFGPLAVLQPIAAGVAAWAVA
jgi:hypothetical protein